MTTELTVLAWGCILAFVHIFAAAQVKTKQYGRDWNMGARDEILPPPHAIVGRLERARGNFFETFPIVIAAVLGLQTVGLHSRWTAIGALMWLIARIVYLPLYGAGVPKVRTLVWLVSIIGIALLLWPLLVHGTVRL